MFQCSNVQNSLYSYLQIFWLFELVLSLLMNIMSHIALHEANGRAIHSCRTLKLTARSLRKCLDDCRNSFCSLWGLMLGSAHHNWQFHSQSFSLIRVHWHTFCIIFCFYRSVEYIRFKYTAWPLVRNCLFTPALPDQWLKRKSRNRLNKDNLGVL